ncbi:MAG: hypothetical protein QGG36_27185 [Pirellulaceae bacterium]|jgi:hypothetical protein|nr:hypothetical protein [Pirellulaceae bacterium]MDP7019511.1 hypothetical protein [Pirellulaceae bacterium]
MPRTPLLLLTTLLTLLPLQRATADGPSPADRRLAAANGWIYDDFAKGLATAKQTGKPLMVVLRCPP